ncbi:MAG TPA: mechanosensitive ion channel domain-containing protein [Methylomirabilota bacterium]|jgi:small conductance mechanosensitive channel|nr:mechanosensitive ion channel domain-containing protein [Methylomirabilota bacterium]
MTAKDITLDLIIRYGFQILGALIILIVGVLLARWIANLTNRGLEARVKEPPMRLLIVRAIRILVLVLTLLVVLDKLGFQIAPLVAAVGVAGVGVGFAFHGVLANIIAGLSIVFTKPYKVGEYIELLGVQGQVLTIELFSTTLAQLDHSHLVIPNHKIVGEILHNYGTIRQLQLKVGVAYGANLNEVLVLAKQIVAADPRVLSEPAALIGISELADSSVTLSIQPWVVIADMLTVRAALYQAIVERFRASKIEIPFPVREVRLLGAS